MKKVQFVCVCVVSVKLLHFLSMQNSCDKGVVGDPETVPSMS